MKLFKSDKTLTVYVQNDQNKTNKEMYYLCRINKVFCFLLKIGVLKLKIPRSYAEKWGFWRSKTFFEKGIDKSVFLWYNIQALNERTENNGKLREKSESVVQVQT